MANILGGNDGKASNNVADNKRNSGKEDDMVIIGYAYPREEPEERSDCPSNM